MISKWIARLCPDCGGTGRPAEAYISTGAADCIKCKGRGVIAFTKEELEKMFGRGVTDETTAP